MRTDKILASLRVRAKMLRNAFHYTNAGKPLLAFASILLLVLAASGRTLAQTLTFTGVQTVVPATGLVQPTGVTVDSLHNIYIADQAFGSILKIAPDGTQTGIGSGLSHPTNTAIDSAGNLYVADSQHSRVVKIATNGTQTAVGSAVGNATGVAVDSVGTVYITDSAGSRVIKVAAGGAQSVIGTGISHPYGIAVDNAGNVYVAEPSAATVYKITPGGTQTSIGAGLNQPYGVSVDSSDRVYIADYSSSQITEISGNTQLRLGAALSGATSIASDNNGNVYVADIANATVYKLQTRSVDLGEVNACRGGATSLSPCSQTAVLNYLIDTPGEFGNMMALSQGSANLDFTVVTDSCAGMQSAGSTCSLTVKFAPAAPGGRQGAVEAVDSNGNVLSTVLIHGNGLAPLGVFDLAPISTHPMSLAANSFSNGLAVTANGDLYVLDEVNCVLQKYSNGVTSIVAGTSCGAPAGDGYAAASATFQDPRKVSVDGAGNIYIVDYSASNVRKIDSRTGIITTVAGTGIAGYTPDGALAVSANLRYPSGLALDSAGNVYIADTANSIIRKIDVSTGVLTTVAGNYQSGLGYSGDNAPATSAQLAHPYAVTLDSAGNMYIADNNNNVIRKVAVGTGVITTVAGTQTNICTASGDGGPATSAHLCDPEGISTDAAGNVYIADSSNELVRKLNVSTGIIVTVAGVYANGTEAYSGDGGPATQAGLSYLEEAVVDNYGNLLIVDSDNHVIRQVTAGNALAAFGTVNVGSSSTALDVTLTNNGSATLSLSGLVPPSDFSLGGADTTCTVSSNLVAGASCVLGIEFLPGVGGPLSETFALTSNPGYATGATQSIVTTGTGVSPATMLTFSGLVSSVPLNVSLGTTFVNVDDMQGVVVVGARNVVTLTITGPSSYSHSLTVTAVSGVATFNLSSLLLPTAGTYTVTGISSGLTASTATVTVTPQVPTQLAVSSLPLVLVSGGDLGEETATIEDAIGYTVASSTAPVTTTITGPIGYSQTVSSAAVSGVATLNLSSLALYTAGSYTVTTTSPGLPTSTALVTVTAGAASQIAVSTAPSSVPRGGNLGTVTGSIKDVGGNMVTSYLFPITAILAGPSSYSQAVTVNAVNGLASFNLTSLVLSNAGSYTLTVAGIGLTPVTQTITVAKSIPTITWSTPAAIGYGTPVSAAQLNATASVPGTFTYNPVAGATLPAGINALSVTFTPVDTSNYTTATASVQILVRAMTVTGLTASKTTELASMPLSFTAQVSSAFAGLETGSVSFFDGATLLAAVPVSASGVAGYSTTSLADGSHTITATYSGDAHYLSSTSASTSTTVTVADINLNLGGDQNHTVIPGAAVDYAFPLSPLVTPTFLYDVHLTATGLPPGATYSFSPALIPAGTGNTPVTLTVQTAKGLASLDAPQDQRNSSARFPLLALGLLVPLLAAKQHRKSLRSMPKLIILFFTLLSLGAVGGLIGCGGGGFFGATKTSGTYTIAVTATSGTLVRTTTVQLTIQ